MPFSPDKIPSLAPDEMTLRRAEKISDLTRWTKASFNENVLWGSISGSASEDYEVIITFEPLIFSCNCPLRLQPCKHSLALLIMYANNELQTAEMPEKLLKWVSKNIKNTVTETVVKTESSSVSAGRERKKNERLELMRSGLEDLERWLYDLMAQGLANVAHSNDRFWENAAARFKDAKLSKVAYSIREIAHEFNYKICDYEKIAIKVGELSLLLNSSKKLEKLTDNEQEELLNQLGRLVRKSEVIAAANVMKDLWTVIGQSEQYNLDGLMERRVWLIGSEHKQVALVLDYLFQGDFEIKFTVGASFQKELYFYPGAFFQRAIINDAALSFSTVPIQFEAFKDFDEFFENYAIKLSQDPWFGADAAIIENLRILIKSDKPFLVDKNLSCFQLTDISENSLLKLLAISATDPMTYAVAYNNSAFEILSYLRNGSICAI